jgi:hypothetical protein
MVVMMMMNYFMLMMKKTKKKMQPTMIILAVMMKVVYIQKMIQMILFINLERKHRKRDHQLNVHVVEHHRKENEV